MSIRRGSGLIHLRLELLPVEQIGLQRRGVVGRGSLKDGVDRSQGVLVFDGSRRRPPTAICFSASRSMELTLCGFLLSPRAPPGYTRVPESWRIRRTGSTRSYHHTVQGIGNPDAPRERWTRSRAAFPPLQRVDELDPGSGPDLDRPVPDAPCAHGVDHAMGHRQRCGHRGHARLPCPRPLRSSAGARQGTAVGGRVGRHDESGGCLPELQEPAD